MKQNGDRKPGLTVRQARLATEILILAVLVFAALTLVWEGFLALAALALMGLAAVNFGYFRCPACGRYLDRNWGEYCQYCGEKLPDDEE